MREERPAVSVIIPIYNVEDYLRQCLDSVLNQTLENIEIICINDGSPDGSLSILREYEERDSRIIVISRENRGVGFSRNEGIDTAKGEFVIFMDPDDWYPSEDNLEELYTKAMQNGAIICGGSMSYLIKEEIVYPEYPFSFTTEGFIEYREYQQPYYFQMFMLNRRMLVENNIYFPNYKRYQDPPFMIKAMVKSGKFYAIKSIVYGYRKEYKSNDFTDGVIIDGILKNITECLNISRRHGLFELHRYMAFAGKGPANNLKQKHANSVKLHLAFINALIAMDHSILGIDFVPSCLRYLFGGGDIRESSIDVQEIKSSFGSYRAFLLNHEIYGSVKDSLCLLEDRYSSFWEIC